MGYRLNKEQSNALFAKLSEKYDIYAPKRFPKQGRYSDTDVIKYDKVTSFDEVEYAEKSTYPMKEVLNPVHQTLFYFNDEDYHEAVKNLRPMLIIGRPCDINAQKIQERIFLGNGPHADAYYQRRHDMAKFVLMECEGGTDTCFCVSMNANKTDDYVFGLKFSENGLEIESKDAEFEPYFSEYEKEDFKVKFVEKNQLTVTPPVISDKEVLNALKKHPMWKEYDARCISCGACTMACSTCTCFTTRDVVYTENADNGERRRVSASCQVAGFDQMAGQREMRPTAGDRMRYKVLHKFHAYDARFHEGPMCVGCGRCTDHCPQFIALSATVNKMSEAVKEIMKEQGKEC